MTSNCAVETALSDFPSSVKAVLSHLRQTTSLPNWALTRDGAAGTVVFDSSVQTAVVRGRSILDRRKHADVLSATVLDEATGTTFGSLVGYVTNRDVKDVADLETVFRAVKARAAVHQPLVELFGSLLGNALAVERRVLADKRVASRATVCGVDPVTGLADRQSWASLVVEESQCLGELGDPAAVVLIEIVNPTAPLKSSIEPTDDRASELSDVLTRAAEQFDFVARLRSAEFAVLLIGADSAARALTLVHSIARLGFATNCGMAEHTNASLSLSDVVANADAAMRAQRLLTARPWASIGQIAETLTPGRWDRPLAPALRR